MGSTEIAIRRAIAFLRSDLGKATLGLFGGVICFCWPAVAGYPAGGVCFYYCIHQFRPVARWIFDDIRHDLDDQP